MLNALSLRLLSWGVAILLCCCCFIGCWDTVTTMSPGDSVDIDTITFGEDYSVDGCVLTRARAPQASETLVITATAPIWREAETDSIAARQKYLNRRARISGIITDVTDWHPADIVRISFANDDTVRCELHLDMTSLALQKLIGNRVTLEGQVNMVLWGSIWLYDCRFVEDE